MRTLNTRLLVMLSVFVAGCRPPGASATRLGYDPVTMDPPARDSVHPARLEELSFESAGARLNGIFYLPAGPGPYAVVVLLHGNPGNERAWTLRRRCGALATPRSTSTIEGAGAAAALFRALTPSTM